MKTVKYIGPFDAVEIEHPPARWITVANGEPTELPDAIADRLAEQADWEAQPTPKPKTAAKKETP